MGMTREEAISLLAQVNKILVNSNSWLENTHEPLNMAFDMAIKALEQEPFINKPCVSSGVCEHDKNKVLDKLRAEMLEEMLSHSGTGEEVIQAYADGLKKGLEFIDKYKAESEGNT
jgi:hypothetical protein